MSRPFLLAAVVAVWILPATAALAADPNVSTVAPNENLVVDGVPPIPAEIAEKAGRYGEYRGATLLDADRNGQVLIATRFGDTNQVCLVTEPFGERTQLTFFPDRVEGALFEPTEAKYFVFHKGAGGAEFYQNYRFDLFSGDITLLTDGKSRNSLPTFSYDGKQIAYTSTRRDGTDTDLYVENPLDPRSDRLLSQCQGGGWAVQDWSVDGRQLLVTEEISINESYLWLVDTITGAKTALTPRQAGGEKVAYRKALFVRGMLPNGGQSVSPGDYKGILVLTDQGGEYIRLACLDPETGRQWPLSDDLPADVEDFALSNNGESIAYTTNDAGFSTLRLLGLKRHDFLTGTTEYGVVGNRYKPGDAKQTPTFPEVIVRSTPQPYSRGVITGLRWNTATKNGGPESFLYFNLANAGIPSDVFYHTTDSAQPTGGLYGGFARFTQSETGGLPPYSFVRPQPIHWKSFDDREVSGFLYAPTPPRKGFIRFWNMLPSKPTNNLVLLAGDKNPITGSGPTNIYADYMPAPTGSYTLVVKRAGTEPAEILQKLPVVLPEGGFITVLVSEKGGHPVVEMFNDTPDPKAPDPTPRVVLRQFFAGAQVKINVNGGPSSLPVEDGGTATVEVPLSSGPVSINVQATLPTTPPSTKTVTVAADFSVARRATLLIIMDSYGRVRPQLCYDGHVNSLSPPVATPTPKP